VPSENFSVVSINAPAEDMSLVWNLKICFLFDSFVSILVRSESGNLSNFRRSFMANTLIFNNCCCLIRKIVTRFYFETYSRWSCLPWGMHGRGSAKKLPRAGTAESKWSFPPGIFKSDFKNTSKAQLQCCELLKITQILHVCSALSSIHVPEYPDFAELNLLLNAIWIFEMACI